MVNPKRLPWGAESENDMNDNTDNITAAFKTLRDLRTNLDAAMSSRYTRMQDLRIVKQLADDLHGQLADLAASDTLADLMRSID